MEVNPPDPKVATAPHTKLRASPNLRAIWLVPFAAHSVHHLLAIPNSGTRHNILGGAGRPLVVADSRVVSVVNTGNLDERSRGSATRAVDLQLSTLDVELCPALEAFVKTDVFHTDQILAGRNIFWDSVLETILLPRAPRPVIARASTAQALLVHLEPIPRAIVRCDRVRGLRHVDKARAGMLNKFSVEQLEADLVSGVDLIGLRVASSGTNVAPEVFSRDYVGEGRVVRITVAAEVVVLATNRLVVDDEDVEDVVGIHSHAKGGEGEKVVEFHRR